MGIDIKVLGCNGYCGSCYENRIRSKGIAPGYDKSLIIQTLKREVAKIPEGEIKKHNAPCVHGGEPLLMKFDDLSEILETIYSIWGRSSIQTNGTLITDRYIELFKKFNVHVGISIDGDTASMNYGRWNATPLPANEIEEGTNRVMGNLGKCRDAKVPVSVITILRKYNAGSGKLHELRRFLFRLSDEYGIKCVRTNNGIVYESKMKEQEELTDLELGHTFVYLADLCYADETLMWQPYRDIVDLLLGFGDPTCVFTECDVWKTSSEIPIDAWGNIGNCLKGGGSIDGIQVLAASTYSNERYAALRQMPQSFGGCSGCRFWVICKGGCPGEGMDNDWRNRTRFCVAFKMLFEHVEKKLKGLMPNVIPASTPPYKSSSRVSMASMGDGGSTWRSDRRVDATKLEVPNGHADCYNDKHGDVPHGDHVDTVKK